MTERGARRHHAAGEVRGFDHTERQHGIQPGETSWRRRRGARCQQHDAGQEREHRHHRWRQLRRHAPGAGSDTIDVAATLPGLVQDEGDGRQTEWAKVVDRAKDDQRRQHLRGRQVGSQEHDDQPVEDAGASGHVTHQPDQHRGGNIPRNVTNVSSLAGSSTKRPAAASAQSIDDTVIWPTATLGEGTRS